MPETSSSSSKPSAAEVHHPTMVGNTFMRQYYHLLAKEPGSLHRFYKDESTWCHGVGSHMQDAISGQKAINDEILRRGYAGARVDLDIGSIDCQPSLHGGVFVLVTGAMTLASSALPKPFVQTFFLAVQPKGYFVLNDCLRFLELPVAAGSHTAPSASDAAVAPKDAKKQPAQAAIGTPVATVASPAAKNQGKPVTPAAKKEKAPVSPTAKATKPTETPVSPIKIKSPAKVASPKAAAAPPAAVAAPASPVKKAAPIAAEPKTTPKPSETKAATPASPAAKPVAAKAPAAAAATPASPAVPKAAPAAPAKPAEPAAPSAPKTWAALFAGAPAASAAPVAAPKLAAVAATAAAAAKPTPASPAKATADAAATPAAATKPAEAAAPAAGASAAPEKEKKRLYSLYIRDVPPQTKEGDLRELFKAYGTIASVGVPAGRGIAFVDYREEESMRAALADDKEFKVHDKVLHVEERKDKEQRSGFRADARGGRGGRGAPKSGRSGERKDREEGKERRPADGSNANGKAHAGDRREKGGRRSGKEDGGRGNSTRAE